MSKHSSPLYNSLRNILMNGIIRSRQRGIKTLIIPISRENNTLRNNVYNERISSNSD